jgi:hypothetical protein
MNIKMDISYIFAPGNRSSEIQCAKYCGEFIASTGETVKSTKYTKLINSDKISCVTFPEINLYTGFTLNIFTLIQYLFSILMQKYYSIRIINKNIPSIAYHSISHSKINLGQTNDIEALQKTYEQHVLKYPNTQIVIFGVSRGSATVFNWLSLYKNKIDLSKIKCVILEGIFDDVNNILKTKFYGRIVPYVTSYLVNGTSPTKNAFMYPSNIPTLIISSIKDEVVPYKLTKNLYDKCCRFHNNFDMLTLNNSYHNSYTFEDSSDTILYKDRVDKFLESC